MKIKSFVFISIIFLLFLVACSPSEEALQVALAQTQTAMVTNTNTPEPTSTFTPEPTFTSTFTPTNTPTLTSTPDFRVIIMDSKELMLAKEDLPPEAKYYLPNSGWISPHHNSEIISAWGKEEGLEYLDKTGRIDGWWVYYARGTSTVRAPEEIFHNIIQYKSAEGAYLSLTEYGTRVNNPDYVVVNTDVLIGDGTIIYRWKEMQPSGEFKLWYIVETTYKNYVSIVGGGGWEKDFDLDYVINIAEIAMDKIMTAPLGNW